MRETEKGGQKGNEDKKWLESERGPGRWAS